MSTTPVRLWPGAAATDRRTAHTCTENLIGVHDGTGRGGSRRGRIRRLDGVAPPARRRVGHAGGCVGPGAFALQLGRGEPDHPHGVWRGRDLYAHGDALARALEGARPRTIP